MNVRRRARRAVSTMDAAARRITSLAVATVQIGITLWSKRIISGTFFVGLLGGAGVIVAGLHGITRERRPAH